MPTSNTEPFAPRTDHGYVTATLQSNIHSHTKESITDYTMFVGGLDSTVPSLYQWDPLKTGFARLFMVRQPWFMRQVFPDKMKKFKHILEYGNTSVSGIGDTTLQTVQMTGGNVGKSIDLPTIAQNDTTEITIQVYELSGSPVRETIWAWINGMADELSGYTHYWGMIEADHSLLANQANQVAEFIYVTTDQTGWNIEFCCMFANCYPTNVKNDHFNYSAGEHSLVEYPIAFKANMHTGYEINILGRKLLDKYRILMVNLDFCSKLTVEDFGGQDLGGASVNGGEAEFKSEITADYWNSRKVYDPTTGKLTSGSYNGPDIKYPPNLGDSIFAGSTGGSSVV